MEIGKLSRQFEATTGIGRIIQLLAIVSILVSFILATALFIQVNKSHRETLVPPHINKTFWIDGEKVSPEYLEQMGLFVLQLAVNNTPSSVDYNNQVLLRYVAPASYGEMETQLMANARRLKRENASTFFSPRAVTPDETTNSIVFGGVQTTHIGDKRVSEVQEWFLLRFAYNAGRIYLLELRATDPRKMFNPDPASDPALDAEPESPASRAPQLAAPAPTESASASQPAATTN